MVDNDVDSGWPSTDIPEHVNDWVRDNAHAVDAGNVEAREALPLLADAGFLSLGAPLNAGDALLNQAAVIQVLARHSFSTAFALWGHRMCLEFLELAGGRFAHSVLPGLHAGTTPGVSAMAPGYKALSGIGDLELELAQDEEGCLRLSGRIPWASHLHSDAIAVAAAYGLEAGSDPSGAQGGVIVAFPLKSAGVSIGPTLDLLAMRGTASTHVTLENVKIDEAQILTEDFGGFLQQTRPTLSILQASFCLGLATASYQQAIQNATGINAVFAEEIQEQGQRLSETKCQLAELAVKVGTSTPPTPLDVLSMRLNAGQVAVRLASLELKTSGGKGFVTTSDTNRRYRESTFIALQSPSEAQLRWEINQAS